MAEHSPSMNFVHNAALPSYLAYVARQAGVKRFIYASSCSVYGTPERVPVDETQPIGPESVYAETKAMAERLHPMRRIRSISRRRSRQLRATTRAKKAPP